MRWLAALGKPVFDQHNAVSRVIGVFIDLTEQEKAAEALEFSDKRFRRSPRQEVEPAEGR